MTALPQLRVRTEFSFKERRDCAAFGPLALVAEALKCIGSPPAGIVDGGTWGHVRWLKTAQKAGFRPLFGTELTFLQPDGRKPSAWALAQDTRLFYRFSTAARQPGVDLEELFASSTGVVRFAGAALTNPDCFDYVDINPASPLQQRAALALARRTGRPIVVTSDNAYPRLQDKSAFMIVSGREKVTPQHLLSVEELRAAIPMMDDATFAEAVRNTHEAAERCASALPVAPLIHFEGDLVALARAGQARRLELGHIESWTEVYEARLVRELQAIRDKDFDSYFLVVADLITWAKERMLVGPGRGSSAGSLLCYLIGITEVDPLVHKLLFERFIDLTRKDLPDIDIDFSDRRREMCFDYLAQKYGRDNVARIGNVNTMKPRTVLERIGRAFAIPKSETDRFTNVLIEYSSGDSRYGKSLEDTLNTTHYGKLFMQRYPQAALMSQIENHASHSGVHAAGVIVSNEPVNEYCTVGEDGVAQIDKPDSEHLNLLKIDALGLSTLGIVEDAGVVTADELYALKLNDPEVLAVFNTGKLCGIFQFEGHSQRRVTRQIEVKSFEQVDHITALARPGPLGGGAMAVYGARAGGQEAEEKSHHRHIEPMVGDTHGVVLYQEQVMRIVREIGNFSWEQTTAIRKAMSGRKGKEYFDQQGAAFVQGAEANGIVADEAQKLWDELCNYGAWCMNKCAAETTRVKLAHPNRTIGPDPTLCELYEAYVLSPSKWMRDNKSMPVLLSVDSLGVARPTRAVAIHKTGAKHCVRLTFSDGRVVECTQDHKFVIDGAWAPCGSARPGASFSAFARDRSSTNNGLKIGGKGWAKGLGWVDGKQPRLNGKVSEKDAFRSDQLAARAACNDCGQRKERMEVHHNDFCGGKERPRDLAWLCSGCHKDRHIAHGDRRPPYARGWPQAPGAILRSIERIGVVNTYDIEMPAPNHNYVLANGIVTHNSHTCAYGIIAYWCAWMKRYHPLEYAAAVLRHEEDDNKVLRYLRELHRDGVEIVPIDPDSSDEGWSAKDGKLFGGFRNLKGFGPVKAHQAVQARLSGKVTDKLREQIAKAHNKYGVLYPITTAYKHMYDDPQAHGIAEGWRIQLIKDIPPNSEAVFIGKVVKKEMRDENETVRVAKRGGKLKEGQTLFTDLFITDDSDEDMICRLRTKDFDRLGRPAFERLKEDEDVVMVRGRRYLDSTVVFVDRIRCLTRPEVFA